MCTSYENAWVLDLVEVHFICVARVEIDAVSESGETVWIREPYFLQEIAFFQELLMDLLLWVVIVEGTLIWNGWGGV
jgi:hypothetical protein